MSQNPSTPCRVSFCNYPSQCKTSSCLRSAVAKGSSNRKAILVVAINSLISLGYTKEEILSALDIGNLS